MNKNIVYGVLIVSMLSGCFFKGDFFSMNAQTTEIANLFPETPEALTHRVEKAITNAEQELKAVLAVPDAERTFENTIQAYDKLSNSLSTAGAAILTIEMLHPDAQVRETAHAMLQKIQSFSIEKLSNNLELYQAITAYTNMADLALLNDEERYYIEELLKVFKKSGITLPKDQREEVKKLTQELAVLELQFDTTINNDTSSIQVTAQELAGLPQEWINNRTHNPDDATKLIIGVDTPTYMAVMQNCSVESTRKALWIAYNNKAYPANEPVLKKIIALRDTLAKKLGYKSYADFIIDDEMAQNPMNVENFLANLEKRAALKAEKEIAALQKELPEGISLTPAGEFKPWDLSYVSNQYKKNHYAIDEQLIAEYFPMENTVKVLLEIYEQFLGLQFKQVPTHNLFWHPDTQLIEVHNNGTTLGHLILDLFPRPNKYGHACSIPVVHTLQDKNGQWSQGVDVVVANFPKSTATKPSLLKRSDVQTFFHEFGHALHTLLGATEMAGFSGTSVKRDFVEMPSQMLEEWLYDPAILKMVSKHYKTGEQLPDDLIESIITLKKFDSGYFVQRQVALSYLALKYFQDGIEKNLTTLKQNLWKKTLPSIQIIPEEHFEVSFGHLTGYSARYYGYLWSKVFALDLFEHIKQYGLLNPEIGKKYIAHVIGKGGSKRPEVLLESFLGRKPNSDAFFKDLGI